MSPSPKFLKTKQTQTKIQSLRKWGKRRVTDWLGFSTCQKTFWKELRLSRRFRRHGSNLVRAHSPTYSGYWSVNVKQDKRNKTRLRSRCLLVPQGDMLPWTVLCPSFCVSVRLDCKLLGGRSCLFVFVAPYLVQCLAHNRRSINVCCWCWSLMLTLWVDTRTQIPSIVREQAESLGREVDKFQVGFTGSVSKHTVCSVNRTGLPLGRTSLQFIRFANAGWTERSGKVKFRELCVFAVSEVLWAQIKFNIDKCCIKCRQAEREAARALAPAVEHERKPKGNERQLTSTLTDSFVKVAGNPRQD